MALFPATKRPAAVVDACFIIGLCANERNKYSVAKAKLEKYAVDGWELFMPGVAVGEVLYVLCNKLANNELDQAAYADAMLMFSALMVDVKPPPNGDASLILRAEQIRGAYGCSRTADAVYLALAEQLRADRVAEVVTFDAGMKNHASTNAATVSVEVLPVLPP